MVERTDINNVLMQMRAIKSQAQQQIPSVNFSSDQAQLQEIQKSDFGDLLKIFFCYGEQCLSLS